MSRSKPQLTVTEYQTLIDGITKHAGSATFTVSSQTFTATEAITFLQTLHDASAAKASA